ncbi:MAG: hypothetical protein PF692_09925 [Kiritimatiellae bacterium]|nr:hypothetical protein [Kiritimatiellia bacterium]
MKKYFKLTIYIFLIIFSLVFFLYPGITITRVVMDSQLRTTGESSLVPKWFMKSSKRYLSWANRYINSNFAKDLYHDDIPATEWPMFGSAFFLVTAETLYNQDKIDVSEKKLQEAIEKAAEIIASPITATWVKTKWGDDYLHTENIFYRMLLMMGLSSYESITGDRQYHDLISEQSQSLTAELMATENCMLNDYPNECYPSDVLWSVAAIQRVAKLDQTNHNELVDKLMTSLNGPLNVDGLPAYELHAYSGKIKQDPRGCGNSSIITFAAELNTEIAQDWFTAHDKYFWKHTPWVVGFTEKPANEFSEFMDVDSGPVIYGFGSMASVFGIGASKGVGRIDRAAPLTMEAVTASWPTPFGMLLPAVMGYKAIRSDCLGEIAILFSMTRPIQTDSIVPFDGPVPTIVVISNLLFYLMGIALISIAVRYIFKLFRQQK